jgi:hypothetical protein
MKEKQGGTLLVKVESLFAKEKRGSECECTVFNVARRDTMTSPLMTASPMFALRYPMLFCLADTT